MINRLPRYLDRLIDLPWTPQASLQIDRWLALEQGPYLNLIGRPKLQLLKGGKA